MKKIKNIFVVFFVFLFCLLLECNSAFAWQNLATGVGEWHFKRTISINLNGGYIGSGEIKYKSQIDHQRLDAYGPKGSWVFGLGCGIVVKDVTGASHTIHNWNSPAIPQSGGSFIEEADAIGLTPCLFLPNDMRRTGYSFNGWTANVAINTFNSDYKYINAGFYAANRGDLSVTANWIPYTWNVRLNYNGGSYSHYGDKNYINDSSSWYTVTYGSSSYYCIGVPTRSGYTFKGWNTSPDGNGTYIYNSNGYANNVSDWFWNNIWSHSSGTGGTSDLYAIWTPNTYTVSYDGNASGVTNVPSPQNFLFNSDTRLSQQVPIRTGYSFVCWKYGSTTFNPGDYIPKGWGSFTLYAQWVKNTYQVKYEKNSPTGNNDDVAGTMNNSTHTFDVSSALNECKYSVKGYTFKGWNTSPDGSGTSYTEKQSVVNLTTTRNGTVILYAQWELIPIEWTASISKLSGSAAFGDKLLETSSYYGTMATKIKSTFGIKKNIVSTGYTDNTPNPLVFYKMGSYADDYLYIYTKLHAGNFDTISYKFCPEIESLVAQKNPSVAFSDLPYSNASDKSNYLSIRLPYEHMEVGKVCWVEVTGRFGTVERTQTLYFKYDKFDMSTVKYVISKQ